MYNRTSGVQASLPGEVEPSISEWQIPNQGEASIQKKLDLRKGVVDFFFKVFTSLLPC